MKYSLPNKMLKKGAHRTVAGQVMWSVVLLGLLAPASYLFGYFKTRDKIDTVNYGKMMSQTAQMPPGEVAAPAQIASLLQPFGKTDVESSFLNGRQVWRAEYGIKRSKSDEQLYGQVSKIWARKGMKIQRTAKAIMGTNLNSGLLVLGTRNGPDQFSIFAYEKQETNLSAMNVDEVFKSNDLPMPPRGAEMVDCSGAGSGNVASFRVYRGGMKFVNQYKNELNRSGWEDVRMPLVQDASKLPPGFSGMMQKGERHLTMTSMAGPRGDQLISLVIF